MASKIIEVVVDACIARASSLREDMPLPAVCRAFLDFVHDNGHIAVFDNVLLNEWRAHQSTYAKRWQTNMMAKRRLKFHNPKTTRELSKFFKNRKIDSKKISAIIKDIHVITCALENQKILMTNDIALQNAFNEAITGHENIYYIKWIMPSSFSESFGSKDSMYAMLEKQFLERHYKSMSNSSKDADVVKDIKV